MIETIGAYQIAGVIGEGGMGVVYRGFDPAIQREVAIKVIKVMPGPPHHREEMRARFLREATAAGRLSHPNLVTIHQFGEEDDCQYLVMECVPGRSLEYILSETPPDAATALHWLGQIASGLDYAHANGVFHRDVKPANILVRPDGIVKITDFGIAKVHSETITRAGFAIGTPAYMAPEQILATKIDGKADQFALAVIAFQLMSGHRPFDAPTDQALMYQILHVAPAPLCELSPAVPGGGAEVLTRALAKDPTSRYETCSEFIGALEHAFKSNAPASAPVLPQPEPAREKPAAKRLILVVAGALLLIAAGVAAWILRPAAHPAEEPQARTSPGVKTEQGAADRLQLRFVAIQPGDFMMGSGLGDPDEEPVHRVRITKGFEMSRCEVTQAEWEAATGNNPSAVKAPNLPVDSVSWEDTQELLAKLNSLNDGYRYRLPTEAEWEYAARSGTAAEPLDLDAVAWFVANSGKKPQAVGTKQANAWGLHDMLGSVWEWCSDWCDPNYYRAAQPADPAGPATGVEKALRGGAWSATGRHTRVANRIGDKPGRRATLIGVRLVREPKS